MITKVIKPSLIAFMLLSGASAALYAVDTDTDSDGIVDSIDLDDDNDGILDTVEVSCTEDGVVDLSAYNGEEPAEDVINNNDIMIGSSKVTLTYTMFGDAQLSTNDISDTHYEGEVGIHFGHSSGDTADYNNRMEVRLDFSEPIEGLKFQINDIDYGDTAIVNAYDGAGNLIELSTDIFSTENRTVVNYDGGNQFSAEDGSSSDTHDGTVYLDYGSNVVSYVVIQYYDTSSSGTMTIAVIGGNSCSPDSDFDGDGILNHLDLDSDNDGIPDNVEAQTTLDYKAPSGIDSDEDGVDDNYAGGLSPVDTDGDGAADYLDLDSDNEGDNDTLEAGTTTNAGADTTIDTTYSNVNFGIDDPATLPNTQNSSTEEVDYRDATISSTTDDDNTDTTTNTSTTDTDGDGIDDVDDIDDDNDGILDTVEGKGDIALNNAGFEDPVIDAGTNALLDASAVPYWDTTASDNTIELWSDGFLGVPADTGAQFAELNAYEVASLYQDIETKPGMVITWSVAHRGRDGTDVATVSIGSPTGTLSVEETMSDSNDAWGHYSGTYVVPEGQTVTRFSFDSVSAAGGDDTIGNFIDSFTISWTDLDSDGDGIPNHLDLDSDNDGIPDNVEAQTTANYTAPTAVSSDGSYANFTPVDTDGDGIEDYLDLDSDNDGLTDRNESGLTLGSSVGINGLDDAVDTSDDYSDPNGIVNDPSVDLQDLDKGTSDDDADVDYRDIDLDASAPVILDHNGTVDIAETFGLDLLAGATDADGDTIVLSTINGVALTGSAQEITVPNGVVNIADDGNMTFVPNAVGVSEFPYEATDGTSTVEAKVTIRVTIDTDGDGFSDDIDLDDDNDGILDTVEGNETDSDGDGIVNSLDLDSDNDGIPDNVEAQPSFGYIAPAGSWSDGLDTAYGTAGLTPVNTDNNGSADYLDTDSDDDGILDTVEAGYTPASTTTDSDGDGILDDYDDVDGRDINDELNSGASTLPDVDVISDDDAEVDYRDIDSDFKAPDTVSDTKIAPQGSVVEVDVLANDSDVENDIDPTTVKILDSNNNPVTELVVEGEGVWSVDPDTGKVTFTPEATFIGDPTPVEYIVSDQQGETAEPQSVVINYDFDNDGIADINDIDDDNDGIPDLVEEMGEVNRDTDGDGIPDSKDLDADNDGILDIIEAGGEDSDHNGRVDDLNDTDQDGLVDVMDTNPDILDTPTSFDEAKVLTILPVIDTDGDGKRDFQDIDSDNDGLSDLVEGGTDMVNDSNNDGVLDAPVNIDGIADTVNPEKQGTPATTPDTDGDGVVNYRDLDSDNDGLLDVVEAEGEDSDGNGLDDTPNTSLANPLVDSDANEVPDVLEPNNDGLPSELDADGNGIIDDATDTDGDGIPDVTDETPTIFGTLPALDSDNDGIWDKYDIDDDNDGIPDLVEEAGDPSRDTDGDGVVDRLDLDSDNDGILDIIEAGGEDSDHNGLVDDATDTDQDGLADVADVEASILDKPTTLDEALAVTQLPVIDTDGDTKRDFQDVDSDNDGLSDLLEGGLNPSDVDSNNDGMIDLLGDSDGNGIDDAVDNNGIASVATPANPLPNSDEDPTPNYRDLDSDNDGLTDVAEANGQDDNQDGIIDNAGSLVDPSSVPDEDADGIIDPLEPNNPDLPAEIDGNGDGIIDDITDTDGDGIPDITDENDEAFATAPLLDSDEDGIANRYDIDDDNDGIPDVVEANGDPLRDTDGDGVIDSLDLDADNDGILDIVEAGGMDSDGDGRVDDASDTDNDGLADLFDKESELANNPLSLEEGMAVTNLPVIDTDGDMERDFQDIDSDRDGLSDLIEGGLDPLDVDSNNDGMIDLAGEDSDGNGIDDAVDNDGIATSANPATQANPLPNSDEDDVPNYRDLDSDNDGLTDIAEAKGLDENQDGLMDTNGTLVDITTIPDANSNGVIDPLEPNNPDLAVEIDANGDGVIDDITDSDGDGIPDVTDELDNQFATAPIDSDGDGIADIYDIDDDNDGIPDLVEEAGDPSRDTDGDGVVDRLDLDSDNDGILDIIEAGGEDSDHNGLVDDATDADQDGLADIVDRMPSSADLPATLDDAEVVTILPVRDTDGDGKRDFQDVDSDSDGITDLIEGGLDPALDADADGMITTNPTEVDKHGIAQGLVAQSVPDVDGDDVPDYRDLDSDNDGLLDVAEVGGEDANKDGLIDTPDGLIVVRPDSDGNEVPDVSEPNNDNLSVEVDRDGDGIIDDMTDSDGDGIPDVTDAVVDAFSTGTLPDSDNDGIADRYDIDDDNDGIPDLVEELGDPNRDTDGDGIVDRLDLDSDNDGLLDILEAGGADHDADTNGMVDDPSDSDKDGLANSVDQNATLANFPAEITEAKGVTLLPVIDTDGDGMPDFQDIDSDSDALTDLIEAGVLPENDTDNNGAIDGDVNEKGIPTLIDPVATPINTDGDTVPDYRDLDSDNDGLTDISEVGGEDTDKDGILDSNGTLVDPNALPDLDENEVVDVLEPNNPYLPSAVDGNGDGVIDNLTDTDNDGMMDMMDGRKDIFGTEPLADSDGDHIPDIYEVRPSSTTTTVPVSVPVTTTPTETPLPVEVEENATVVPEPTREEIVIRDDIEVAQVGESVSIDLLENDAVEAQSIELVVPEDFDANYELSPDKKTLIVEGEGSWQVDESGIVTFTPEEGFDRAPTPIAYQVLSAEGERSNVATIALEIQEVEGVNYDEEVCQTSDSVPTYGGYFAGLVLLISSFLGLIFSRREK